MLVTSLRTFQHSLAVHHGTRWYLCGWNDDRFVIYPSEPYSDHRGPGVMTPRWSRRESGEE